MRLDDLGDALEEAGLSRGQARVSAYFASYEQGSLFEIVNATKLVRTVVVTGLSRLLEARVIKAVVSGSNPVYARVVPAEAIAKQWVDAFHVKAARLDQAQQVVQQYINANAN